MSTITLKIDERSKAGKALKDIIEVMAGKPKSGIEIIDQQEKSNYNPKFVEDLKVAEKRAKYKVVDPNNVWESIK